MRLDREVHCQLTVAQYLERAILVDRTRNNQILKRYCVTIRHVAQIGHVKYLILDPPLVLEPTQVRHAANHAVLTALEGSVRIRAGTRLLAAHTFAGSLDRAGAMAT